MFNRFPKLKIVLGKRPLEQAPSFYLKRNMLVTTSGQFDDVSLIVALSALGTDRVLFSVDYPYKVPPWRAASSTTGRVPRPPGSTPSPS